QHLGTIDVADARQDGLVHQELADGARTHPHLAPGLLDVTVSTQRVRTQLRAYALEGLRADQVATRRTAQVRIRVVGLQAQSYGPDRSRHLGDSGGDVEAPDQPEVDVDEPFTGELDEELLADRVG